MHATHSQGNNQERNLISANQVYQHMDEGGTIEKSPAQIEREESTDQAKQEQEDQVAENNAMLGNTLTPNDVYAATGLPLGKVGKL